MTAPKALQLKLKSPDFMAVSGSKLYGTNRPTSDDDLRGFIIPPHEYLLDTACHKENKAFPEGLEDSFDDRQLGDDDHKVCSARKFLHMTMKGDPQNTELFFVPEDKIVSESAAGNAIIELRDLVVSNVIYTRVMGYGNSEWRKAMGVKLEVTKQSKKLKDIVNDIRNECPELDKYDMDSIIEIMMSKKPTRLVPSKQDLGEKRKLEFEKYGFGVTSAAHAIRLREEMTELMLTGNITFPRPNAAMLLDIRMGKYDIPQVTEMFEAATAKAEEARPKSILQDKPKRFEVLARYDEIVRRHLLSDERFMAV